MKYIAVIILCLFAFSCKKGQTGNQSSQPGENVLPLEQTLNLEYAKKVKSQVSQKKLAKDYIARGKSFFEQKNFSEALNEYQKALTYYADANTYFKIGEALFRLNNFKDAKKAFSIALKLGYEKRQVIYYRYAIMSEGLESYTYLNLAYKNGYNELDVIRSDPDLVKLCYSCLYLQQNKPDYHATLLSHIFSYCFNLETIFDLNMTGEWKVSFFKKNENTLKKTFYQSGKVETSEITQTNTVSYNTIKTGTYSVDRENVVIRYTGEKTLRLTNDSNKPVVEKMLEIDKKETIKIFGRNEHILFIDIDGRKAALMR